MTRLAAVVAATLAALLLGAAPALAQDIPDSTLDPAFSTDGKETGPGFSAAAVARATDGAVIAVGGGAGNLQLRRYTKAGAIDTSWGAGGSVTRPVPGLERVLSAEYLDDRVVVLGAAGPARVVRVVLRATGIFDTGYSGDGIGEADLPPGSVARDGAGSGTVLADGPGGGIVIARFCSTTCSGDLFDGFSGDGIAHDATITAHTAYALRPSADGYYVVGHRAGGTVVSRYTTAGDLDTGLGGDGRVELPLAATRAEVAIDSERRPLIVRKAGDLVAVTRLTRTGETDTGYGEDGTRILSGWGNLEGVAIADDALLFGGADTSAPSRARLARLTRDGSADELFAPGGVVDTEFPEAARARAILIQPDGRILAAGQSGTGHALARHRGAVHPSFRPPHFEFDSRDASWSVSPVQLTFNRTVKNAGAGSVRLRRADTGALIPGSVSCRTLDYQATSCATGRVTHVFLKPSTGLAAGQEYRVTINEPGTTAPLRESDGEPLPARSSEFEALRLLSWDNDWLTFRWPRVKSTSALGGYIRRESTVGTAVQLDVTGSGDSDMTLYATTCPTCTRISVRVHHGYWQTPTTRQFIDLAAPTTTYGAAHHIDLPPDAWKATIVNEGSSSGSRFDFDGWKVGSGPVRGEDNATFRWRDALLGDPRYFGSTIRTPGGSAEFRFRGSSIRWDTVAGPDQGIARIYVDGVQHGPPIDNYAASAAWVTREVTGLPAGEHSFRLEVTGTKNAASRYAWVSLRSFEVLP